MFFAPGTEANAGLVQGSEDDGCAESRWDFEAV